MLHNKYFIWFYFTTNSCACWLWPSWRCCVALLCVYGSFQSDMEKTEGFTLPLISHDWVSLWCVLLMVSEYQSGWRVVGATLKSFECSLGAVRVHPWCHPGSLSLRRNCHPSRWVCSHVQGNAQSGLAEQHFPAPGGIPGNRLQGSSSSGPHSSKSVWE